MKPEKLTGHAAMFGANAMWGLMSPVAKAVMTGGVVTPLVVTDLRVAGAMLLFWTASLFRRPEHVPPADMMKLFGASLLAIVFNQGCFIFGVGMTSPVDASIITTSMPLVAMILAAVLLKEPVTGKKLLGIAAGFRNVWVDARRLERGQAEIDAAQAAERESRTAAAPGGEGRRNPGVPKRPFLPEKKHEQESTGSLREKHSGDALPDADKAWKAYAEPERELTEEAGASAAADTERNRKNGASPGRTS